MKSFINPLKSAVFALLLISPFTALAEDAAAPTCAEGAHLVQITTNQGEIVIRLDEASAPNTVANFLAYVDSDQYQDTLFHRVVPGFMIQGGGFDTQFNEKATREPIENEANNGLQNRRGTVAMARTHDPHSATAQFFINLSDNTFLDHTAPNDMGWGYTVFGEVVDGMDVVDKIAFVRTDDYRGHQDVPTELIVIEAVTVIEKAPQT